MGIRKELMEEKGKMETETEGLIVGRVRREEERWRIMGVYVGTEELGKVLQKLERWMGIEERVLTIIGGDFNARIGRKGGVWTLKRNGERRGTEEGGQKTLKLTKKGGC